MAALGRKLDEFVGNLGTAAGRMKIRINIADRLRASEQEEYPGYGRSVLQKKPFIKNGTIRNR